MRLRQQVRAPRPLITRIAQSKSQSTIARRHGQSAHVPNPKRAPHESALCSEAGQTPPPLLSDRPRGSRCPLRVEMSASRAIAPGMPDLRPVAVRSHSYDSQFLWRGLSRRVTSRSRRDFRWKKRARGKETQRKSTLMRNVDAPRRLGVHATTHEQNGNKK